MNFGCLSLVFLYHACTNEELCTLKHHCDIVAETTGRTILMSMIKGKLRRIKVGMLDILITELSRSTMRDDVVKHCTWTFQKRYVNFCTISGNFL